MGDLNSHLGKLSEISDLHGWSMQHPELCVPRIGPTKSNQAGRELVDVLSATGLVATTGRGHGDMGQRTCRASTRTEHIIMSESVYSLSHSSSFPDACHEFDHSPITLSVKAPAQATTPVHTCNADCHTGPQFQWKPDHAARYVDALIALEEEVMAVKQAVEQGTYPDSINRFVHDIISRAAGSAGMLKPRLCPLARVDKHTTVKPVWFDRSCKEAKDALWQALRSGEALHHYRARKQAYRRLVARAKSAWSKHRAAKLLDMLKHNPGDALKMLRVKHARQQSMVPIDKWHQHLQHAPAAWKVARISPLFKDTDPTDPNKYRMLAVSSVLYRLYANVLRHVLTAWCMTHKVLPAAQFGFIPGRSTMQPMFILRHLVHAQKASADAKHRKLFTAFIDFKQAYDHIPRQQLWEHLRVGVKLPQPLLACLEGLYRDDSYVLIDGPHRTPPMTPDQGVKQGCPINPLLFALYVHDISKEFLGPVDAVRVQGTPVTHFMYADDLTLVSTPPHGLQRLVCQLQGFADRKHLSVNVGKSKDPPVPAPAQDPPAPPPAQAQPPAQPPPIPVQRPQAPPWGRWLDRDTNPCLNFQRIGESKQRPIELCQWDDLEALPSIGKEYQQRYKLVNDRLPKCYSVLFSGADVEGCLAVQMVAPVLLGVDVYKEKHYRTQLLDELYSEVKQATFKELRKLAKPSPAQPSPAQPSPAQPSPAQPSPAQPSPAQPSPAQPSPAQPRPAQPSPAQPSPAQQEDVVTVVARLAECSLGAARRELTLLTLGDWPTDMKSSVEAIVAETRTDEDGKTTTACISVRSGFWTFLGARCFPNLRLAAVRLLAMHVTTAAAERNWSSWGNTYNAGRSQLNVATAEKMVFIKANIPSSEPSEPSQLLAEGITI
ncbi:hypothetical protein QJQ45_000738 [Haematococcus lacustris]|nr:hypothetical protein QJQ45_000738 [Haematococcus lacustris]